MKRNIEHIALSHPIDLRYKYVKRLIGGGKKISTTIAEQKKLKRAFLKIYPDNLFYDELGESNSVGNNCRCVYGDDSAIVRQYISGMERSCSCNHDGECDDSCDCDCGCED